MSGKRPSLLTFLKSTRSIYVDVRPACITWPRVLFVPARRWTMCSLLRMNLRPRLIVSIWPPDPPWPMQSLTSGMPMVSALNGYFVGSAIGGSTRTMRHCLSRGRTQGESRRLLYLPVLPRKTAIKRSVATPMVCGSQQRSTCIMTTPSKRPSTVSWPRSG